MGLRFRKSFKVAPGVRVNVGKKSVGVSVGGKGFRKSVNTSGRVTTSIGVPGTGLSYVDTKSMNSKKNKSSSKRASATVASTSSVHSSAATAAASNSVQNVAVQSKEKQPKIVAKLYDKPDASYIVIGIVVLVVAFFLSGSSIPAGIIVALFGVYFFYTYIAFKQHPEDPQYITDEQALRWGQLVSSDKKTVYELKKASVPMLIELKKRTENYCDQLSSAASGADIHKYSELLLNAQQKIVDLSEFVILKGDEPQKDFERYFSLVEEVK